MTKKPTFMEKWVLNLNDIVLKIQEYQIKAIKWKEGKKKDNNESRKESKESE